MSSPDRALVRVLLVLCATLAAVVVLLAALLLLRGRRPVRLSDLSPAERQRAVDEELDRVGTVFVPSSIDPRIGYALAPNAEIRAWGGAFRSNDLGYRAPALDKPADIYRVLFVGDSWVFGLGEDYEDTFPAQFERLYPVAPDGRRVQSWALALPGYNALNEAAALEVFAPRLEPDLVVWCPTNNDVSSSASVDPRGFLVREDRGLGEPFDDGIYRDYSIRFPASSRYLDRWRRAAAEYRRAERWLAASDVPVVLFFVARWRAGWPEWLVAEAGFEGPWAVVPEAWNERSYRNAQNHGTPEVYRRYAEVLGRLADNAVPGWRSQEGEVGVTGALPSIRVGGDPRDLDPESLARLRRASSKDLPVDYRPARYVEGAGRPDPCSRTLDCASGRMGHRAAILLRRADGARRLVVSIERIEPAPRDLYPLELQIRVPSGKGDSEVSLRVPRDGPGRLEAAVDLPAALAAGEAFEVELIAERAALAADGRELVSLVVAGLEQRP